MDLDISDSVSKRAWVLRSKSNEALERKLRAKAEIIKSIAWKDAIEGWFDTLFFQLIGLAPTGFLPFLLRMQTERDLPKIQKTLLAIFKAQHLLLYLYRVGKYAPKIAFYCPLYSVASPKIHLFDLTEPELKAALLEADKKTGANIRLDAMHHKIFKEDGEVALSDSAPKTDMTQHPLYNQFISQRQTLLDMIKPLDQAFGMPVSETIAKSLTDEVMLQMLSSSEQTYMDLNKQLPFTHKYEAETRKSLYHTAPEKIVKIYASDAEYKKDRGLDTPIYRNASKDELKYYRAHYPTEQTTKLATPEEAYSEYSKYVNRAKGIAELGKKLRNADLAYREYSIANPDISKEDFDLLFSETAGIESSANRLTAKKLGISESHCEKLRKDGSKLHHINEVWKSFSDSLSQKMST